MKQSFRKSLFLIQPLEQRVLMAFEEWGEEDRLIQLPDAIDHYQPADLIGTGQTVAVIDSGIDYTHPALGGGFGPGFKVVGGHDFVDNDDNPMDTNGHGTEVAGVIAASDYVADGLRHRGVAPGAKLVALRIGTGASGDSVPDSRIEQALQWVIDHRTEFGITVINISYGTGSFDQDVASSIYGDEIATLTTQGVSIVAASGNGYSGGLGIDAPAANVGVISVGSVGVDDRISDFTERGDNLDLLAPGEFVYSTVLGGGFSVRDGTSFSAPFVAGTVALMKSVNPTLRPMDVESILIESGKPNFDGDTESAPTTDLTFPRLNILAAMELTSSRLPGTTEQQETFGQYGNGNALTVDRFGITHFVYYYAPLKTMLYSTRSTGGVWSLPQVVDDSLPFQGFYLSIAVGNTGRPEIAYFDGVNGDLEYATFDGQAWTHESVDTKNSTGAYPSILIDQSGLAAISYFRKTTGDLRIARHTAGGTWTITAVDTVGDVGRSTSMSMDSNGKLGIAYEDTTHGTLKYATFDAIEDEWNTTTVDRSTRGVSFISTTFDKFDSPLISYYDATPANLKFARFSKNRWRPERLANRGATGLFSTVFVDDRNRVKIVFFDKRQNATILASAGRGGWQYGKLQSDAGRFTFGARDPLENVLRYSYLDTADYQLRFNEIAL